MFTNYTIFNICFSICSDPVWTRLDQLCLLHIFRVNYDNYMNLPFVRRIFTMSILKKVFYEQHIDSRT